MRTYVVRTTSYVYVALYKGKFYHKKTLVKQALLRGMVEMPVKGYTVSHETNQ